MKDLMKTVNELYEQLTAKLAGCEQKTTELNRKIAENNKTTLDLQAKHDELSEREARVRRIEDVAGLKHSAEVIKNEIDLFAG